MGPKPSSRPRVEPRDTQLVHEECQVGAGRSADEDINGDGRPDRRTAQQAAGASCRTLDFDFDGVVDAWVYLDAAGRLRRREYDFDRNGVPDEVWLYQGGVLHEQRRATARPGKLDTWHYFSAGKLARTERDANGDDYIDQWWEYPAPRPADCPLIHSDVDGDGRPDPGATVDVCRDRYGAGSPASAAPSAATGVSELPTEVPSAPAGGSDPPTGSGAEPAGSPPEPEP